MSAVTTGATPHPDRATPPLQVISIGGDGRSGSTLLAGLLATAPGVVNAGEVRQVWLRGLIENRLCGCGRPFLECPAWSEAVARAFGGPKEVDARRMLAVQHRHVRTHRLARIARGPLPAEVASYAEALRELLVALAEVTGCRVVVDATKGPAHGALLRRVEGLDVRTVQLVRDPRAVAYSWQRRRVQPDAARPFTMPRRAPSAVALRWLVRNAAVEWLRRERPEHGLLVRYEDLAREPVEVLARVLGALEDPPPVPSPGADGAFRPLCSHPAWGNPSRLGQESIAVRPDEEWKERLGRADRWVVSLLTWPLRRRHGLDA